MMALALVFSPDGDGQLAEALDQQRIVRIP